MQQQTPQTPWFAPLVKHMGIIVLVLFFFFFGSGLFFYHSELHSFVDTVFWWLKVLWFAWVIFCVFGIARMLYVNFWHKPAMEHNQRKQASHRTENLGLKNELLAAQVDMAKQVPVMLKYAMDQGLNVSYNIKGEFQAQHYLSHLASMGGSTQVLPETSEYVPEPYTMSDTLQHFTPSKDGILLAKGKELITVPPGESLCHTTFTGNTDAGKTNDERMLAIQLLYLQQTVYWCDMNYQPFRPDAKRPGVYYDYSVINNLLAMDTVYDTKTAVRLLQYLYNIVQQRRDERRKAQTANAIVPFKDIYLFFDELPAFAGESKDIMDYIGRLLREARQYGVFFVGAAQDLLNATLSTNNGAIRENLLTNYYGGGDMTTARMVLNLGKGERIDETGLGIAGTKYLRAKGARIERMKVRTPYADNEATELLLRDMVPFSVRSELPRIVESELSDSDEHSLEFSEDLRKVYNAVEELVDEDEKVTARRVAELTGFGKDKANFHLNELEARGIYTGRLSDRQTEGLRTVEADRQTDRQEVQA